MKIAVEGCAHGDLDNIFATLQHLEQTENTKIDLLICCGDFQAVRNEEDLEALACPPKYRSMNTFWKYYCGEEKAPYPVLFVGGNHEASNYLWELYYGGWVAPNIRFLGFAGVIHFGGLRIGGLSGIYNIRDYRTGHYERAPYNNNDIRSVYHVREYDVEKLMQVDEPLDIFISHDWPRGIAKCGNVQDLLKHKPFFQEEVERDTLGSKPAELLLQKLKPSYWFAAHLHTKFAAVVEHRSEERTTKFLALDRCLPNKNFLQIIDFPVPEEPLEFRFDEEWLAITRAYNPFLPLSRSPFTLQSRQLDLKSHRQWVHARLSERGAVVPTEFSMTAPPHDTTLARQAGVQHPSRLTACQVRNPQTEAFLELLELPYLLDASPALGTPTHTIKVQHRTPDSTGFLDPDEIQLNDSEDELPDDVDELEAAIRLDIPNEEEAPVDDKRKRDFNNILLECADRNKRVLSEAWE
ncbi:hypothetical protein O6H91_18G039300 [Diphasiastrum complanatum]|uniref:Uncharacterized protein n=6 Tax=Diphasiastrum complanatum TaxID=34168 RepID=A0ACC2B051_DIPCM|nr:hypothetical protein O6H91_18G039300 [Diphasiastrum complanatum]KAJ7523149.1 hypothetical protein O6H91_18G039300 [Diphasiastrum complanatum]KAJ7523150.1 hypothetical protein O6H91_18G039300 [Diphasiastrum complanatum]KAJ7523151.1 hypothetical protein O6H91_18G039300 [Diphasiastrum complanatum]KAJ7523152.1 hypothetical protein O6H91_18G039300 [Diphasiastrum complanatum]